MKKIITFLLFTAFAINLLAQFANEQENLRKYWYYRKRLQENFIYTNPYNVPGSNIPVDRLVPSTNMVGNEVVAEEIKEIVWDDCNGALPHYIMMLATEYKLLKKYNQNTTATLQELNRAVQAVKRLDTYADGLENGVFRRNDILFLERSTTRHPDTLGAHAALVNHFDNKSGSNLPVRFNFAERFKDVKDLQDMYPSSPAQLWEHKKKENKNLDKYNSVDNVIKFIEAEAIVRKLLEGEGTVATAISNRLKNSVKLMIQNMYHPYEPRKTFNRNAIANSSGFMQRYWYLKDPDLSNYLPLNLIPVDFGGAGDPYAWAYGYGLSKSAEKYNVQTSNKAGSKLFFKVLMNRNFSGTIKIYRNEYFGGIVDTVLYAVDSNNIILRSPPRPAIVLSSTLIGQEEFIFNKSMWIIRSLAATNDIPPNYIGLFSNTKSTYKFLIECAQNFPKVLEQYPLIWSVLNTKKYISNADRAFIGSLLNSAPTCGPYNLEYYNYEATSNKYYYDYDVSDWSCPNRFVWPELNGGGYFTDQWKRSGYFNGIDYMLLHNLYWLTKVDQAEYSSTYVDNIVRNQSITVSGETVYDYARNSVKLKPGFKVSVSNDHKYVTGTNPDMRTGYDQNITYHKVNVTNYASECNCDPIFKEQLQKSATITGSETMNVETKVKIKVKVFPNPGNNMVSVACNEAIQRLVLINSIGKIVFDNTGLNTENHTFTIAHLPAGIYMLKTTTHNGYDEVRKIVKKE